MEAGNVGLEDALSAYEQGVTLAKQGHKLLDQAEKRIEVLVSEGPGGIKTEALDSDESQ